MSSSAIPSAWQRWSSEARRLIADFQARKQAADAANTGTIAAACEECGKTTSFPAKERDSVQNCPHCGSYMDVTDEPPGPDETEPDEASAE